LWRHAGSQFDIDAVRALSATLPTILQDMTAASEGRLPAEVVPFEGAQLRRGALRPQERRVAER
jgi:hypothetical protein